MNVSHSGRRRRVPGGRSVAAVAMVLLAAGVAALPAARAAEPLRLFPQEIQGNREEERAAPKEPAPMAREVREGILAVDDLGAVSIEATGVLDAGNGGLPVDIWQGSERDVVERALAALPVDAPSLARQDLVRRLLLTVASPPPGKSTPSLLERRVRKLLALGATEDARRLVAAVAADQVTEDLAAARVDTLLVDGRLDEACALAEQGLLDWDSVYWQKVIVFCSLRAGRVEQASLNLTMLREQGVEDPPFVWAAEQLSGVRVLSLSTFENPTPLTLAMFRATGRPYPTGILADPEPWVLRAVALGTQTEPVVRVVAAERAVMHGAMSGDELAAVYRDQSFEEEAFAQPLADLVAEPDPLTGALLFQLAERQTVPAAIAEVVLRALGVAEHMGRYMAAAALYAPMIETLEPGPDLMWFAESAARALYALGRFDSALEWYEVAAGGAATDSDARMAADALWPLYRLAAEAAEDRWPEQRMEAWRVRLMERTQDQATEAAAARRVAQAQARLLSLLQATGDRVRVSDWAPLWDRLSGDGGFVPTAPRWHALAAAADELRVGEAVVLALMVLEGVAPEMASDAALYHAVESLRLVGLEAEARRIAVEAAVVGGI